jgi:hypothetical protein
MLLPTRRNFDPTEVTAALDRLAADHDRLWHLPVRFAGWDAEGFVEAQLADRYVSVTDKRFNRMRLRSFTGKPEELPQYQAWQTSFADGVQLLGSYVTINGDPQAGQAEAGQWLRVTLWWLTSKPLPRDYKVFVHAVDAQGQIVAQHDSMPRNNAAPTSQWRSGQVVMDVHEFQIPPDNTAVAIRINAGLYDPETGERLMLLTGDDHVSVWQGTHE